MAINFQFQKLISVVNVLNVFKNRQIGLDLKNSLFNVIRLTQLRMCRLKTFYWTPESKTFFDYFKLYFSNACLNFVEHILFPSKQKLKRTDAWFPVSKRFVFSESFEHWAFIIDGAATAFPRYFHFTLTWRIARKFMEIIDIHQKMLSRRNSSLFHINEMYTLYR